MKIAIPTKGERVDDHFGHCENFTIYSVDSVNHITNKELYHTPKGCGCKAGLAELLKQKGVTILLAGNIGQGAISKIQSAGIELYSGCTGSGENLLQEYLKKELIQSAKACHQHSNHLYRNHQCQQ